MDQEIGDVSQSPLQARDVDGAALLERMRAERGYVLSFHEIYGRLEPRFLEAYADLYRACTLTQRYLPTRWRELIWVSLLNSIREQVGSIHLDRAADAGVAGEELAGAVQLAAVAEAWEPLAFAYEHWNRYLIEDSTGSAYLNVVASARGPLAPQLVDLILLVVQAARQRPEPFLLHLRRCLDSGIPETQIAEGLSYVMQPLGVNRLLWATDVWLQALRDGTLPPSPTFNRAEFETRLS